VEAALSAESLLEKENRIEGVSRKISVDPICENVEFAPHKLCLLMGSREVGQISTQAVGGHHLERRRRDFSRVLPKTEGAIGPCDNIPIRWVLRIVGEELLQLIIFWKGARAKSVGIPEVGPVAEWSKAEAILDKSPSSSKKSGSESEEVVELRRAKEACGLEGKARVTGPNSRGVGAGEEGVGSEVGATAREGKAPRGLLGQIAGEQGDHLMEKLGPVGAT
jgi:hypothetical protein